MTTGSKPRKTFAQQLAERQAANAARVAKQNESMAKLLAKAKKTENPALAKAATTLDTLQRAAKILDKIRTEFGQPGLTLDDCIAGFSNELESAMPALLAEIESMQG